MSTRRDATVTQTHSTAAAGNRAAQRRPLDPRQGSGRLENPGEADRLAPPRRALLGTSALTAAAFGGAILWAGSALALPVDGQVLGGSADISYGNSQVTVDQHTDRAIIEWRRLDIGADETMRVNQPTVTSVLYNTTTQADVSRILGRLVANGQIILHNPNGIVFGPGADIDVQSIVATTIGIDQQQFMDHGVLVFDDPGLATAVISNAGEITAAEGGLAALVAPGIENSGIIQAEMGTVALAAGNAVTLDFYGDGLIRIAVTEPTQATPVTAEGEELAALISHTGAIHADGGTVIMTAEAAVGVVDAAINLDGIVQARSIDAFGGQVALVSDSGLIEVAGTIDVSGDDAGEVGGTVHVLGEQTALQDGATIDASGEAGGGTVLVGGDYQGGAHTPTSALAYVESAAGGGTTIVVDEGYQTDGYIPEADIVYVEADAAVDASAVDSGDGGTVIVWADEEAEFHGSIAATGGANGGDGGFVEVSSAGVVTVTGSIDVGAMAGLAGSVLVDPENICLAADQATCSALTGYSFVDLDSIVGTLEGGADVTVDTSVNDNGQDGDVRILDAIAVDFANNASTDDDATFQVLADGGIVQDAAVTGINGALSVEYQAVGEIDINAAIAVNGGGSVALFSQSNIRADASIQADGILGAGGNVSLVAGWDGVTTDIATILGTPSAYGNNGGAIFIGDGTQTSGIAVGARYGTTAFAGAAMTLLASDTTAAGFAQAGYRTDSTQADFDIDGAIAIALSDGTGTAGNLVATAGGAQNSYVQVGHGGLDLDATVEPDGDYAGDIDILVANDLIFTAGPGGSGVNRYAQLGHGGYSADGSHSGAITITQANDIRFIAGINEADYAQLGHGGMYNSGDHGGTITITQARDLVFAAGLSGGANTYAQLGHGGAYADGDHNGAIAIAEVRDMVFFGGSGANAYAQLGHGGYQAEGDSNGTYGHSGAITITQARDLFFWAGSGSDSYVQLGHGGDGAIGNHDGDITITEASNLSFIGGFSDTATGSYAQLGHGGISADGDHSGAIAIGKATNLSFLAGSAADTYAQLGHGGMYVGGDHEGAITINEANDLIFTAGDGIDAYAQLGHGGHDADGRVLGTYGHRGAISIFKANDLIFTAGSGSGAYVQLGLGGDDAAGNHSGTITIDEANDLIFTGGDSANSDTYAQLGHGGSDADGTGNGDGHNGDITLTQVNDILFTAGNGTDGYAQLGHGGDDADGDHSGAITIGQANDLIFTAGTSGVGSDRYAQLGHGGENSDGIGADGDHSGDITIAQARNLTFVAGDETATYAQLGHGGTNNVGDHSGAITITQAANLTVVGGAGDAAYAQLGHGDASGNASGTREGDIDIRVTGETSLVNGTGTGSPWLIGHATTTADGISNADVSLVTGTLDFDNATTSTLFGITDDADGADFADKMIANLAGGDVTLGATNGTAGATGGMFVGSPFVYGSVNTLNLFSTTDIRFGASVQNGAGTAAGEGGAVNVVAGWDGATTDIATILGDTSLYGNSSGSIYIGDGSQTAGIAVGARYATTSFAGAAMTLLASDTTENAFAQAGYRADSTQANFDIDGAIAIALSDGTGTAGNLVATAGDAQNSYVQVGHGGVDFDVTLEPDGDYAGDIEILAVNDVTFTAGDALRTYAQLGHGGGGADGSHSGAITIGQAYDLTFTGGPGFEAYAQLGHGGRGADGNHDGAITITQAHDLTFTAGSGDWSNAYAQLGHGGGRGGHSGNIAIGTVNDLTFTAGQSGAGENRYAQLGHGGLLGSGLIAGNGHTGAITITQANDIRFTGGSNRYDTVQLGHGGRYNSGDHSGAITITQANDLVFTSGDLSEAYAQLGHGGTSAEGSHSGDITLATVNNLEFTGGDGTDAYVQLGHGGEDANGDHSGAITIGKAYDLIFAAGTGNGTSARIGHGGYRADGNHEGNITITEAHDLTFAGGLGAGNSSTYAQLGHGGYLADGNRSGNITITQANDLTFQGGDRFYSYAQLGHGGRHSDGDDTGNITLTQVNDLVFSGGIRDSAYAQLGHGGDSADGSRTGDITIEAANNLTFTAGSIPTNYSDQDGAYAQLGHGGTDVDGSHSGAITIRLANDVTFTGGTGLQIGSYAQLGHGGRKGPGDHSGDITIAEARNLTFAAGDTDESYAQLGHGGYDADGDHSGAIELDLYGNMALTGADGIGQYAIIGHGDDPGDPDAGDSVSGDITIRVNGNVDMKHAVIGHLIGSAGSYSSGNTWIGVAGTLTADAGSAFFSRPDYDATAGDGELRIYLDEAGDDNVDALAQFNGTAHGTGQAPNNQGQYLFGNGPYAPARGNFAYYTMGAGGYSYIVDADAAANIVADLGTGSVTLDAQQAVAEYGALYDWDGGKSFVRVDSAIDYTGTSGNTLSLIADEIFINAAVDVGATGTLFFDAPLVDLDAGLAAAAISGTATIVNVLSESAEIQDAIDVAAAGATVTVGDGTFAGGVVIDKALTLLGDGFTSTTTVTVDAGEAGFTVAASDVTVDGFLFQGINLTTTGDRVGVLLDGATTADITGISIVDNGFADLTDGVRSVGDIGDGDATTVDVTIGGSDAASFSLFEDLDESAVDVGDDDDDAVYLVQNVLVRDGDGDGVATGSAGLSFADFQDLTVTNVAMTDIDDYGIAFSTVLDSADTVVIEDSQVTSDDSAVAFLNDVEGTVTIAGNALTSESSSGVAFESAVTGATVLIGGAADADANTIIGEGDGEHGVLFDGTVSGGSTLVVGNTRISGEFSSVSFLDDITDAAVVIAGNGGPADDDGIHATTGDAILFDGTLTNTDVTIGTATVTLAGTNVTFGGNGQIVGGAEGIDVAEISGGSFRIADNTLIQGGDERSGIEFEAAIGDGAVIEIVGNTEIRGGGNAIEFGDPDDPSAGPLTASTVTIAGNTIVGEGGHGIFWFNDGSADVAVTDAAVLIGAAEVDVDGDGIIQADEAYGGNTVIADEIGIYVLAEVTNTATGTTSFDIIGNTIGDATGAVIGNYGIVFDAVTNTATDPDAVNITIAGNTIGGVTALDEQLLDEAGIWFSNTLTDATVLIGGAADADANTISLPNGGTDDGILVHGAITGGRFLVVGNTRISAGSRAIAFNSTITDGTVVIAGNGGASDDDGIHSEFADAVMFNGDLTNTDVTIGTATVTLDGTDVTFGGNSRIVGSGDGIDVAAIDGGRFRIADNTLIQGGGEGAGIELEGSISNGAVIEIVGNAEIRGGGNGIEFGDARVGALGPITSSTVTIAGNTIVGEGVGANGDGIWFSDTLTDATVLIGAAEVDVDGDGIIQADEAYSGNTIIADEIGISVLAEVTNTDTGTTTFDIIGNTIGDATGTIIGTEGIAFGDVTNNATDVDAVSITIAGNTIGGVNGLDEPLLTDIGIRFGDGDTGATTLSGATVMIGGTEDADANTIVAGDEGIQVRQIFGGRFLVVGNDLIEGRATTDFGGDGIAFNSFIGEGSEIAILGNTEIRGGDDGVDFNDDVGDSTVTIAGNAIYGDGSEDGTEAGIQFGHVSDSTVSIGTAALDVDGDGVVETYSGNTISATLNGIYVEGDLYGTTSFGVTDNLIGTSGARVGGDGIVFVGGLFDSATATIGGTGQAIYADGRAIRVNDLQSATTLAITGGTYDGTAGAVLVDNTGTGDDGRLEVGAADFVGGDGSTVFEVLTYAGDAGVAIAFDGAASFDGGDTGIRLSGPGIDIENDTLGSIAFTNQATSYVELTDGAEFDAANGLPTVIDASGVTFDGALAGAMTDTERFALEGRLVHYLDTGDVGLLHLADDGQVYAAESIQLAVNVAGRQGAGEVLVLGGAGSLVDGAYGGSVEVWVDGLTLTGVAGANGDGPVINTDEVDEFANNGDVDNGFQVAAASTLSGGGDVSGVTIDGFAFDSDVGDTTGVELGFIDGSTVSIAGGTTLQDSRFTGLSEGIVGHAVTGTTTVTGVTMTDIDDNGISFNAVLDSADTVVIEDSQVTSDGSAVAFHNDVEGTVTIAGNTLTSESSSGVVFESAVTGATVLIGGAEDADANIIFGKGDGEHGIVFGNTVSGGSILVIGNTRISGEFSGVGFLDDITDAAVVIAGNGGPADDDGIHATTGDAILFDGTLTNTDVTIGTATVTLAGTNVTFGGNGQIVGGAEGIDVAEISGGSFRIADNTLIQGGDERSGIEFEAAIGDGAVIEIVGNTEIRGGGNAIEFGDPDDPSAGPLTASTVTIAGNTIVGEGGHGIFWFNDGSADVAVTDAAVLIGAAEVDVDGDGIIQADEAYGGNTVIADEIGIYVLAEVTNTATGTTSFDIIGNTIGDATGTIIGTNGIAFGDVTNNAADADAVSITIAGNTIGGVNASDEPLLTDIGIRFGDEDLGATTLSGATVMIGGTEDADANTIVAGFEGIQVQEIDGGRFLVVGNDLIDGRSTIDVGGDGIAFDGFIGDGAEIAILGNTEIRGGDDGVDVNDDVEASTVTIAGNAIYSDGSADGTEAGIQFVDVADSTVLIGAADVDVDGDGVVETYGGNTISATLNGIYVEGDLYGTTSFDLVDNLIGASDARVGSDGIVFAGGLFDSATANIGGANQAIYAAGRAISVNNLQSATTLAITGGTYDGTTGAVLVDNDDTGDDGRLAVGAADFVGGDGSTVFEVLTYAGDAGVAIAFDDAATFDGGATGIRLSGPGIDIENDTLGSIAFTNQATSYVELTDGAEFDAANGLPTVIDASGVTFDGALAGAMTDTERFALEGRLVHYLDTGDVGLLHLADDGQVYAAESIQLAVNVAGRQGAGEVLVLGGAGSLVDGAYGGSVEVWVDGLTLTGVADANGDGPVINTDEVDDFANNGDVDNGFRVAALSALSGGGDVSGVTIDGFSFDSEVGDTIGVELGFIDGSTVSTAAGASVQNGWFQELSAGIVAYAATGTTTITGVDMSEIGTHGIAFLSALDSNDTVAIEDSAIQVIGDSADDVAVLFAGALDGTTVTIAGSAVASDGADAIRFADTLTDAIVLIGGATAAAGNSIIIGVDDGIDVGAISGGSFTVANNAEIVGERGHGILFGGTLDSTEVTIADSGVGSDGADAIRFADTVADATVLIGGSTIVSSEGNGITLADTLTDATLAMTANTISGSRDGIAINGIAGDAAVTLDGNTITFGSAPANSVAGPLDPADWNAGIRLANVTSTVPVAIIGGAITGLVDGGLHLGEIGVLIDNAETPTAADRGIGDGNGTVLIDGVEIAEFSIAGVYVETNQIGTPAEAFADGNGIVLGLSNGVVISSTALNATGLWINGPETFLADSAAADRAADVTLNDTTFDLTFSAGLPDADATGPGRAAGHTIYLETFALWNFDGAAEPAPFVVDVSDVTWTTTIDGVTTTIDAGPDGGFTEEEIETLAGRIRDNFDGFEVGLTFLSPPTVSSPFSPFVPLFGIPGFGIDATTPGDAAFHGGELIALLPDIFAEGFGLGQLAGEANTGGGPGGLEPAVGGGTDDPEAGDETCVETFFADFWAADAACETAPGEQTAALP